MSGSQPRENLVGQTFDKCRILAKLGTGGMGSVWLAEHFGLNKKVALKILPTDMGTDPEYVARFMREATTAGRLEHPHIVQVYDVGYSEGRHYIMMQYVDGESLSTVVEHLGAMEPRDAARIAAGILRGLSHAHAQGVVHRDIKPDNILVTQGDQPKILDFGLAIETETALQITKDGMVVGTPYYLSPEQARGKKATPLSDQYSVGVTLYYLLTGKRPFNGATALAVLNQQIHEIPVPPIKHRPTLPKALNHITLKLMAKRPQDRYLDAAAAAGDLEAYLAGRQVAAKTVKLRVSDFHALSPKRKAVLAGSAAGVLVLILALVIAFSGGSTAPPTGPASDPGTAATAPAAPSLDDELHKITQFETANRDDLAAYPEILTRYDDFIRSTTQEAVLKKAEAARAAFQDFVNAKAQSEFDRLLREPDPVLRLESLDRYPRILKSLTTVDARIREERPRIREEIERRFGETEQKLDKDLAEGRFDGAPALIEDLLRTADGVRKSRLERLRAQLPRLQKDFDDQVLRKATGGFAKVHFEFEKRLLAREIPEAYAQLADFVKGVSDEAERSRVRVGVGVNYDGLLAAVPDSNLTDARLGQARASLVGAFSRAQDTLSYRVLADFQDALDLVYLIRAAGQGMMAAGSASDPKPLRMETFQSEGLVKMGRGGLEFYPLKGQPKQIVLKSLHPADLLTWAARAENLTPDQVRQSQDLLSRATGAAYLYSSVPERWAKALDWFARAGELGVPGLEFRLEGFRERGYQEVRDRVRRAQASARDKKFDVARKLLDEVSGPWSHDGPLKQEIDRAYAGVLAGELRALAAEKEWRRMRDVGRPLLEKFEGLYDPEAVHPLYSTAVWELEYWSTLTADLSKPHWIWPGRAEQSPAPAAEDRRSGQALRFDRPGVLLLSPAECKPALGFTAQISVFDALKPFQAGLLFDVDEAGGRHRKLVVQDPGEIVLYEVEGKVERRVDFQPLVQRLGPGRWVNLAFMVDGPNLVCLVDRKPVFVKRLSVGAGRGIGLATTAPSLFRDLQLRRPR